MLQDIFPYKLNNQYDPKVKIENGDKVIFLADKQVLINECITVESEIFPSYPVSEKECSFRYLFEISEKRYFLAQGNFDGEMEIVSEGNIFRMAPEISVRGNKLVPKHELFALYTAIHLNAWYKDNRFCGRCGKTMYHSDKERCMICDCGYHAYPRIMPAVIVGVKNGDKILITKYRSGYQHSALVAGFTEIGETAEETVAREVMEEAGIKVKNITYYKSQPWGTANDLLLGFYCELEGDDTIRMDEGELKYAAWVKREDIELQPDDISLTNEMMKRFKEGKE